MKIKNLKTYIINEIDGTLENYDKKTTVTIKRNVYELSCNPGIDYKLFNTNRIKYTEQLNIKLKDKYVYHIRRDMYDGDMYVLLTFFENLKFVLLNKISVKNIIKTIFKPFKWSFESLISLFSL